MERPCTVTVSDSAGVRHSLRVTARSTFTAACYFESSAISNPSHGLPRGAPGMVYEVQVDGQMKVHRVEFSRMMAWANRESAKAARRYL